MITRRTFIRDTTAAGIAGIISSGIAPAFARERAARSGVTLEDAWELHRNCLIIDAHQDTSVRRFARNEDPETWLNRDTSYHTDVPRMTEGGQQSVGFFLIEDGTATDLWTITEFILEQIDSHPDTFKLVLTSDDAVQAGKEGKVGVLMEIEGPARWLNGNVNILRLLHRLGLRCQHITHGEGGSDPIYLQGTQSVFDFCALADRESQRKNFIGLTPFGYEVLKTQNELGIVVDTAHCNDRAFYDVIEHSATPPIMSHTAVFAFANHYRCLTDDQIRALASRGGVMGIFLVPRYFSDPDTPQVEQVVDHIQYVADLAGMDTIGFGSDYDGFNGDPAVASDQLVTLTHAMMKRGFTDGEIRKFWGGNFLRILRQVIDQPGMNAK